MQGFALAVLFHLFYDSCFQTALASTSSTGLYLGAGASSQQDNFHVSLRENAGFFYKTPWLKHVMIGVGFDWFNNSGLQVGNKDTSEYKVNTQGEGVYVKFTNQDHHSVNIGLRFGVGELRTKYIASGLQRSGSFGAVGASLSINLYGNNYARLNSEVDFHWLQPTISFLEQGKPRGVFSITPLVSIQIFEIEKR